MHCRILPDHQKLFFKKDHFERLEWLKTCFDAFSHTSRPPKFIFLKRCFWTSGVIKNVFWCICAYSQTTRNCFFKKDIFYWLEWLKTCFDAFAHTPRPPETFFQKDIFYRLEWLKTCFDAFPHTSRPPEKFYQQRYFWKSGVVKNVFWCICENIQTSRIFFSKKIFLNVWRG